MRIMGTAKKPNLVLSYSIVSAQLDRTRHITIARNNENTKGEKLSDTSLNKSWSCSLLSPAEEPSTAIFHYHEQPRQKMDLASKIWGRVSQAWIQYLAPGPVQPFPGRLYLGCFVCALFGTLHQPLEALHRLNDLLPDSTDLMIFPGTSHFRSTNLA